MNKKNKQSELIASLYGQDLIDKMKIMDGSDTKAISMHEFILDNMTEGIFIVQDGIIKYANKYSEEIFGFSSEEAIGNNALEYIHPDDRKKLLDIHKKRMEGKINKITYEYRLFDNKRNVIWVHAQAVTITWDGKPAVLQFVIDITERINKEKELQTAYEIINKSSSIMFIWKNVEGWPVEFVTKNVTNIFGYTDDDFLSKKVIYSELIHKDDIKQVVKEVQENSENKNCNSFAHKPYRIVTKNGDIKWLEDKTVILRDNDGNIVQYQGIIQDITKSKEIEDEREKIIIELKEALKKIKTLEGLIPICTYCKSIRNDEGYWNKIEEYISMQDDAHFSHGICPACMKKLYPDIDKEDT